MGNAVPGLWGGGNAASLMEARSMAESAIRDERAHARRGFAEMESAGERSDAEDGNVEIVGSKAQGHKISATEQLLAARAPGSILEATDAKALGTIQESTAHTSPEQVAMLRRLGLNRVEVCGLSDRCGAVAWSATTASASRGRSSSGRDGPRRPRAIGTASIASWRACCGPSD